MNGQSSLAVGDVVELRSGGLKMTIGFIENDMATCYWVHDHEVRSETIPIVALKRLER